MFLFHLLFKFGLVIILRNAEYFQDYRIEMFF